VRSYKIIGARRFHELQPGDMFKAVIHDIRPGEVTIRFSGGEQYTARSMVLPEARIGEESLFSVRENDFDGRIILEMVKSDAETKKNNMLAAAITNAGLSITPELLELGRGIIDSGLPVDSRTLHKATFFAHAARGTEIPPEAVNDFDSVIFLLRENMPVSPDAIHTLNRILQNPKFLLEPPNEPELFDPSVDGSAGGRRNPLPDYFRRLYTKLAGKDARDNLLFMARMKQRKYFQLPFAVGGEKDHPLLAEFHSNAVGHASEASALVAIETTSLGRVEVLVQKNPGTGVSNVLKFRADNDYALTRLRQTASRLTGALSQKGISVTANEFTPITEPFTILSPLPDTVISPTPERFTFDMRV